LVLFGAALLGQCELLSTEHPTKAPQTPRPTKAPHTARPTKPPKTPHPTKPKATKRPTTLRPTRPSTDPIVLTQNLYLGADLTRVVEALFTQGDIDTAVATSIQITIENNYAARMATIATEINDAGPDLVGLQEVTVLKAGDVVVADFKSELLRQLPDYEEVITTSEGLTVVPGGAASLETSNTILKRKRADLIVTNARFEYYSAQAPGLGVKRNWQSVDVTLGKASKDFRFYNTHLESENNEVSTAQALQVISTELYKSKKRVIFVGDFNSGAGLSHSGAYDALTNFKQGKLRDHVQVGQTCCRNERLTVAESGDEGKLYERIDLALTSVPVHFISGYAIGVQQVGGLYPSDHAGVVAKFRVP